MTRAALLSSVLAAAAAWLIGLSPLRHEIAWLQQETAAARATATLAATSARRVPGLEIQRDVQLATLRALAARLDQDLDAAWLLAGLTEVTSAAGVGIVHFKPQPVADRGPYRELPVAIQLDGAFHDVVRVIDAMVSVPPVFGVRQLHLKATPRGSKRGAVAASFTLSAYAGLSGGDRPRTDAAEDEELEVLAALRAPYEDEGRRDPFGELVSPAAPATRGSPPRGSHLAALSVDDVVVRGVAGSGTGMLAILETAAKQSFVVRAADRLADSSVLAIDPAGVSFARQAAGAAEIVRKPLTRGTGGRP